MKRVFLPLFCLITITLAACNLGANPGEPSATPSAIASAAPTALTATTAPTSEKAASTQAANAVATGGCAPGTGKVVTTASELKIEDLLICNGIEAKPGMTVTVNYVGTLKDGGAKFDSSFDRGKPYVFVLGLGQVIKGWDEGVTGMKVGGKRRLTIPPTLAYGNRTLPGIPPGSTLVFEVTLISAK